MEIVRDYKKRLSLRTSFEAKMLWYKYTSVRYLKLGSRFDASLLVY